MARQGRRGEPGNAARWLRKGVCILLTLGFLTGMTSCTRRFFRRAADKEVNEVLTEKDQYPQWRIEQYHVYPDPRARFADPTDPDRTPKPPDDPAAYDLSPNPQRPGKAGVARVEGTGYLALLAAWDAENRAKRKAAAGEPAKTASPGDSAKPPEKLPPPKPAAKDGAAEPTTAGPQPYLITLEQSVELGLINARDYQDAREGLYLAALPVTLQRFSFAAQFFATEEAIRERGGSQSISGEHNRWIHSPTVGFNKLFSTGAKLLFEIANQTTVELTGSAKHTVSTSTLTLDLLQPLLRGGGRAVTLEPLTQAERNLLYQIRSFAHFRESFYVEVAGGGAGQDLTTQLQFSALGFGSFGSTTGYLPTVLRAAITANDNKNVTTLREYYTRFLALASPGGNVSQLQVDQVKQNLLTGVSTVLQDDQTYGSTLDQFKTTLGLPTDLPLQLDDSQLNPLTEQFQRYEDIFLQLEAIRNQAGQYIAPDFMPKLRAALRRIFQETPLVKGTRFQKEILERWNRWEKLTQKQLTQRIEDLKVQRRKLLDLQIELEQKQTDLQQKGQALPEAELARMKGLAPEIKRLDGEIDLGNFEDALRTYESRPWQNIADAERRKRLQESAFHAAVEAFVLVLHEASNERLEQARDQWPKLPRLCVNGVDLLATGDVGEYNALEAAGQAALINRFDLMNRRAQLVDAWRQIAVDANALLGTFNVEYNLTAITPPGLAQPLNFNGHRMRNQLILNTQLPLVRMFERNTYRSTLIDFQRARRGLMLAEDQTLSTVRNEIRQLRAFAENYTIQQEQVELGYKTRDNALESFVAPPAPSAAGAPVGTDIVALTNQLLQQQQSLVRAQNGLLQVYISYLTTRFQLYRDLELMPLDFRGVWTDEIATTECANGAKRPADSGPCNPAPGPEPRRSDSDGVSEWLPIARPLPPAAADATALGDHR